MWNHTSTLCVSGLIYSWSGLTSHLHKQKHLLKRNHRTSTCWKTLKLTLGNGYYWKTEKGKKQGTTVQHQPIKKFILMEGWSIDIFATPKYNGSICLFSVNTGAVQSDCIEKERHKKWGGGGSKRFYNKDKRLACH